MMAAAAAAVAAVAVVAVVVAAAILVTSNSFNYNNTFNMCKSSLHIFSTATVIV